MTKPNIPIIEHIPYFLAYYKKKGYSHHTQENYKIYLQRFIVWLKKNKKQNLKPYELTIEDIDSYKTYLSRSQGEKGHLLKKITQNYYLIALRALLSYFVQKDIQSIHPGKITLPRAIRARNASFLNPNQIKKLLSAPDIKTKPGLRDKAILEVLVSIGPKVSQLIKLE